MRSVTQLRSNTGKAFLVDLDNVLRDADRALVDSATANDILSRLLARAGEVEYALAIAPDTVIAKYGAVLAAHGLRWAFCERVQDGADRDLCLVACDLVERGYDEIFVASADHYFSCLARVARVTVIVPEGAQVHWKLYRHARVLAA